MADPLPFSLAATDRKPGQSAPFSIRLLGPTNGQDTPAVATVLDTNQLILLFPASYRTESDDLIAPSRNIRSCIKSELDLQRLGKIHRWLWMAGRLLPPQPLHHHPLFGREILVTERMDMHLVWTTGKIFIKPLPRFLLEPCVWTKYLCCGQDNDCSLEQAQEHECEHQKLWKCALGFLFSYAALVRHESDFLLAKEKHLLPEEVTWSCWIRFTTQLDTEHVYPDIDQRFYHGELRLGRLNKIYRLFLNPLTGFMAPWDQYNAFFRDNFAWLAGTTVYIAVVLTAMQVGLATDALAHNDSFQSASYGFTVFSILGPLVCGGLIGLVFCFFFVYNLIITLLNWNTRLDHIQGRYDQESSQ